MSVTFHVSMELLILLLLLFTITNVIFFKEFLKYVLTLRRWEGEQEHITNH